MTVNLLFSANYSLKTKKKTKNSKYENCCLLYENFMRRFYVYREQDLSINTIIIIIIIIITIVYNHYYYVYHGTDSRFHLSWLRSRLIYIHNY